MAGNKLTETKIGEYPRKAIPLVTTGEVDDQGRAYGRLLTSPELAALRVVSVAQTQAMADDIDSPGLLATLTEQAKAVNRGDLAQVEAMLSNQATALQSLFVRLIERGMSQAHMPNLEGFMRLGLKAQAQCRATLETLAAIKNPPVIYARQANVTSGPQQINNGPRVRETEKAPTQLLEQIDGNRLDCGAAETGGAVDPALATLGAIDRAEVPRR